MHGAVEGTRGSRARWSEPTVTHLADQGTSAHIVQRRLGTATRRRRSNITRMWSRRPSGRRRTASPTAFSGGIRTLGLTGI